MLKIISVHRLTSNDERGGTPVQITEARLLYTFLSFSVVSLFVDCTNEPFQTKMKAFCK